MRLCLFEDRFCPWLEPLSLTRPVFDLLCGATSLGEKQLRWFRADSAGVLLRPALADLYRLEHPGVPANDLAWLRAEQVVLVNGRWLPPPTPPRLPDHPQVALVDNVVAYAVVPAEQLHHCSVGTLEDCLENWKHHLPQTPADGVMIQYPWQLVQHNAQQLHHDLTTGHLGWENANEREQVAIVGPRELAQVHPEAHLDPFVVLDTTGGPIRIERGAVVTAFSRIEGPCWIGPDTHVLGAKVRAGTTLGPNCRVGGEIEASIVHGHSNKYHEGFLGHSYVGEWVNLGAGTHTSDLRNDYGEVTVVVNETRIKTGLNKVGCFIGDHTKTGLGTLINTGSNLGVFCNVLPAGPLTPRFIPSFCWWWNGRLSEARPLPELLATAKKVMVRRGKTLTEVHAALFRHLQEQTAPLRRRLIQEIEPRWMKRSA